MRQSLEYFKAYYQKNKERINKEHSLYYEKHKGDWVRRQERNKDARKANADRWARNNREKINIAAAKVRQSIKEAVINMYSNGDACCRWCGHADIDVLQLDHINDDGARDRKGRDFYRWLQKNDYPPGFQVLCANCNIKKEICRSKGIRISYIAGGGASGAF